MFFYLKSILYFFEILFFVFLLISCGSSTDSSVFLVDNGVAQKGALIQGSQVTINELSNSSWQPTGTSYSFETNDNFGTFNPSGVRFTSPYLSTTAQGYFFNELSGATSTEMVFLRGLSNISAGNDSTINVNVLSNIVKNRVITLLKSSQPIYIPSFTSVRSQAEKEFLNNIYIYNVSDIFNGTNQPNSFLNLDLSRQRPGDQILAAVSGLIMRINQSGLGVSAFLNQVENDLSDDGILNATSTQNIISATTTNLFLNSTSTKMLFCSASNSINFSSIASNLNRFYKTAYSSQDISKWVDSSGCNDMVIDKNKFITFNSSPGTWSKSEYYVTGSDDSGQCISIGSITQGATASIFVNGTSTPVSLPFKSIYGQNLSLGIYAGSSGTYSAFIQRSSPLNGVCSSATPIQNPTRLYKFTVKQ